MGTIGHHFESGEQASQKGHFRNLIMLARIDGVVGTEEKKLLDRIARRLSLTDEQVKEVLDDSNSYPMIPPVSREERYERLIQLTQMICVDGNVDPKEEILIHRYGIALGFTEEKLGEKFPIILAQIKKGIAREEVLEGILR